MDSIEILEKLIAFDTVSDRSNMEMVSFICSYFGSNSISTRIVPDTSERKASIFATVGPPEKPGVMLSGHTDVVPVEGQAWTSDPFVLAERDGRLYGRGTADMKGFLAAAMRIAVRASTRSLSTPLHLAFSYDEEIGCVGVRPLIERLSKTIPTPLICIVGEPTSMAVALGHKGKLAARITFRGTAAHSSLAPLVLNALHMASDALDVLRAVQEHIQSSGNRDLDYDIPYSTVHAGVMAGGSALNIVPDAAFIDFEIRTIGGDEPGAILADIEQGLEAILVPLRTKFPSCAIQLEVKNEYPGLTTTKDGAAATFVGGLFSGAAAMKKVAFGTEGGLFQKLLCTDVVVCGPGSMEQGHRPDEYIDRSQLVACDQMLEKLLDRLA